jgi:hypothetical protein
MFFYLSFLRPPPATAIYGDLISFTPQIANDLRTELCTEPLDIFYSWIYNGHETTPIKLTTWRTDSAYKVLSIPSPNVRSSAISEWILILSAHYSGDKPPSGRLLRMVDLTSVIGKLPLPISSAPIRFLAGAHDKQPKESSKKQDEVDRLFAFGSGGLDPDLAKRFMRIRERTSFDLDKVLLCFIFLFVSLYESRTRSESMG